jgi:predicted NAD/FAD-binding protein
MRIAIVGSGVSGLVVAHRLHERHECTVFEARDRVGGHVRTVPVPQPDGSEIGVDIGFIVYNEVNYPEFTRLLQALRVPTQPSNMSFGVRCDGSGLEYSSHTTRSLFAQKRNVLRPAFLRTLRDILRFNRRASAAARDLPEGLTLGDYLESERFSPGLSDFYLKPMGSALWSIPHGRVLEMPLSFFVRFFENHGMLTVNDQPEWRVVCGGSERYVEALTTPFRDRIVTGKPVRKVHRTEGGVVVDGAEFDQVVFACHSDQALAMLSDASDAEHEILSALPYQSNRVVLHTDTGVLPRRRLAWSSWNYRTGQSDDAPATVTYNMNLLQTLRTPATYCVTLNDSESIDPEAVLYETDFSHPVFTVEGMRARARFDEISGRQRTHFCGAYWGYGFHEDGVRSGLRVADAIERVR